ncbi:MAG: hypothetical protein MJ238_04035 [Bacilli bacterium]|nr:hypothetical protein [Bacilli bacterium]
MENWIRKTPLQNIAFIAMMAAINGAFSIMLSFIPYSSFLALLVLPVINALGVYLVNKKWLTVYIATALLVPFLVTMFDISTTLFYILPSIVSGFIYGALSKAKFTPALTILVTIVWSVASTYLSLPIIKAIYGLDMIETVLATFGVSHVGLDLNETFEYSLIPTILFALAWASSSISHFIIVFVYEKVGIRINCFEWEKIAYPVLSILISVVSIATSFLSVQLAYLFFALGFYFMAFSLQNLIESRTKTSIITMILLLVFSILLFAALYSMMPQTTGPILLILFVVSVSVASLIASLKAKKLAK